MWKPFYIEIQPLSDNYVKEALEIAGLSMQELKLKGTAPKECMKKFADWIAKVSGDKKPIFVASPILVITITRICPQFSIRKMFSISMRWD